MPTLVDNNDQSIGFLVDSVKSIVLRKVGNDWLWLEAPPSGFVEQDITFYHADVGCHDARLFLINVGSQGLVFPAQMHSGSLFYTKAVDVNGTVAVHLLARETVLAGDDAATKLGDCTATDYGDQSAGVVESAVDPALLSLSTPFKIK